MRHVFIAGFLLVLTAAASFWMGRLSATSATTHAEHPVVRLTNPEDVVLPSLPNSSEPALTALPNTPPRELPVGLRGTAKGPGSLGSLSLAPTRPAAAAGVILATVKREHAIHLGRGVGPDGITFEPVHHTTASTQTLP